MRRILITGATGKIGKAVISKIPCDISIIIISKKNQSSFNRINCKQIIFDLEDYKSLPPDLWNATEVLHMAGATHEINPKIYFSVNTDLTQHLIKLCKRNKINRFTYMSSQAASELGGAYSKSKFLAEKRIIKSKLSWTILRPSEVYGEGINCMLTKLCKLVDSSFCIPIIGDGLYCLNPVHIDDLSDLISKLIISKSEKSFKKIYTLCGPSHITFINFCKSYASYRNKKIFFFKLPVYLCKVLIKLFNIMGIRFILVDQIDRLTINKSNDNSLAFNDYGYSPCNFKIFDLENY